jgi:hypothetical protein
MVLGALKRWALYAAMIARIVLVSTLLLGACSLIFQPSPRARLFGIAELLLGTVIATGWKTRYAAALVLLSTLATISPAIPFHAVSAQIRPSAIVLIVFSGFLICFGRNNAFRDRPSIRECSGFSRLEPRATCAVIRDANAEVTIRLESPFFRNLLGRRCIVTLNESGGRRRKTQKEVWYAKDDCETGRSCNGSKQNESPNDTQITQNESS